MRSFPEVQVALANIRKELEQLRLSLQKKAETTTVVRTVEVKKQETDTEVTADGKVFHELIHIFRTMTYCMEYLFAEGIQIASYRQEWAKSWALLKDATDNLEIKYQEPSASIDFLMAEFIYAAVSGNRNLRLDANLLPVTDAEMTLGGVSRAWREVRTQALRLRETSTMGVATLVSGTVTVSAPLVVANARIFLTPTNTSGTAGHLRVSAINPGVSFTISSSSSSDTRTVQWVMFNPA